MGDLEETIFQKNVPGKWSSHNEYFKDDKWRVEKENEDFSEEENEVVEEPEQKTIKLPENLIPERRGPNTGVKGVLADKKYAAELECAEREFANIERQALIDRIVYGARADPVAQEMSVESQPEDIDDLDIEDDDFLESFRAKRLEEMRGQQVQREIQSSKLGVCKEISAEEFLSEICEAKGGGISVIHYFSRSLLPCTLLNKYLDSIAARMKSINFFKMMVTDYEIGGSSSGVDIREGAFMMNIPRDALPMLSFYKNGELLVSVVGAEYGFANTSFLQGDIECLIESVLEGDFKK